MTPIKDLNNLKFGRWKVQSFSHRDKKKHQTLWNCSCQCGTERKVHSNLLVSGKSRSCGCLAKDLLIKRIKGKPAFTRMASGRAAANCLYRKYRWRALKKGLSFDLSEESFISLTSRKCHYCRISPSQVEKSRKHTKIFGDYTYNGLDRVNNFLGYTLENSVPCCKTCNSMKNILSQEDFISHIKKILDVFEKSDKL